MKSKRRQTKRFEKKKLTPNKGLLFVNSDINSKYNILIIIK